VKLKDYLLLPAEITPFERAHLARTHTVAWWFFVAHVPVLTLIAALNGTQPLLIAALSGLTLLGPLLAKRALTNPRRLSAVYGITAMGHGRHSGHRGPRPDDHRDALLFLRAARAALGVRRPHGRGHRGRDRGAAPPGAVGALPPGDLQLRCAGVGRAGARALRRARERRRGLRRPELLRQRHRPRPHRAGAHRGPRRAQRRPAARARQRGPGVSAPRSHRGDPRRARDRVRPLVRPLRPGREPARRAGARRARQRGVVPLRVGRGLRRHPPHGRSPRAAPGTARRGRADLRGVVPPRRRGPRGEGAAGDHRHHRAPRPRGERGAAARGGGGLRARGHRPRGLSLVHRRDRAAAHRSGRRGPRRDRAQARAAHGQGQRGGHRAAALRRGVPRARGPRRGVGRALREGHRGPCARTGTTFSRS
jgi:hypothetical protein